MDSSPKTSGHTGCLGLAVAAIIILTPIVGDVACTVFILNDDLTPGQKGLWIVAVWLLPWVGRSLYLLVGQQRDRVLGGS